MALSANLKLMVCVVGVLSCNSGTAIILLKVFHFILMMSGYMMKSG